MRINAEELQQSTEFTMLTTFGHDDIVPFVREYYWQRQTWVTVAHTLFSIFTIAIWVLAGLNAHLTPDGWAIQTGLAALALFVLLPPHEAIHGAVYRAFGAPKVEVKWALHKGVVCAIAPQFVVNSREFAWVAIAPFLVINVALLLAAIVFPPYRVFFLGALMGHTSGTGGDCAMLNYLWIHRRQEVYTYDDSEAGMSYFFARSTDHAAATQLIERN